MTDPVTATIAPAMLKVAGQVMQKASEGFFQSMARRLSSETSRIQVQFTKTFQDQLARSFEKSGTVKTIISKDTPVPLEDIYVPLTLSSGNELSIPDLSADPTTVTGARFILSGTGGAGKTFLMKHLLNVSQANDRGLVPLFVELRNVQFDKGDTLEDCIYTELKLSGAKESHQLFIAALEEGIFAIYLDGFDEIHPEESERAVQLIKRFATRFTTTSILITTRPKTGIENLQLFKVFNVQPLSKEQAVQLITKTTFDIETKEKFLREMQHVLYDKHKTLMSLPILLGMMLLTYRTYADIPDRMTIFYGQAFETLYSIHDAENKELFKRKHNAGLAPDLFKKVLQAFCYLALSNHDIEFTPHLLDSYIARALKISMIQVNPDAYRSDLIHNVCVLQPEGLTYVFVHRSFQEYFAAQFALDFSGSDTFKVIDQVVRVSGSGVAEMMMEIDEIKFKRNWVLPRLAQLIENVNDLSKGSELEQFFSIFPSVHWHSKSPSFSIGEFSNLLQPTKVLSSVLKREISIGFLVKDIKFPSEKKLLFREPGLPKWTGAGQANCIYYSKNGYKLEESQSWVVRESGFCKNLSELRDIMQEAYEDLSKFLVDYATLEDSELFN